MEVLRPLKDFGKTCTDVAPRLATLAMGVLGGRADAEDIVQQAFAIAIEKDARFETESQLVAWLATTVRNCALNHRRKSIRRKTYATDPLELTPAASPATVTSIDQETGDLTPNQNSFDDEVCAALQLLTEKSRCCLLLRTVQELSYKEISELMNMPEGTAMNLVHRSKKRLSEILTADGTSPPAQEPNHE